MIYKTQLEYIHRLLNEKYRDLFDELKYLPEGSLHIVKDDDYYYYYERFPKSGNRKKEHRYGIPDLGYYPDFTILRPRDNKIIYWEHFGKVNDEGYVMDNIEKVTMYIRYGITPWDNLIMTYNNKEGGFDARIIEAMIESLLL